jgi:hypothetical protein
MMMDGVFPLSAKTQGITNDQTGKRKAHGSALGFWI